MMLNVKKSRACHKLVKIDDRYKRAALRYKAIDEQSTVRLLKLSNALQLELFVYLSVIGGAVS